MLINEVNGFCVAADEFAELELDRVVGVHLAGGELVEGIMWDAHSSPVPATDIEWLERLLPDMPNCTSVIIERDEQPAAGPRAGRGPAQGDGPWSTRVTLAQSEA